MTFVGFDVRKRYVTACALDAGGEIIAEVKQLDTSIAVVLAWLRALPGPVTVGVEATLGRCGAGGSCCAGAPSWCASARASRIEFMDT